MQHYPVNPDSRPLPPGWNQHYDSQKRTWYYICMNVRPPHVTVTHPLGPTREASPSTEGRSSPGDQNAAGPPEFSSVDPLSSGFPRSPPVHSHSPGLSFAQQLYASSVNATIDSSMPSTQVSSSFQSPHPTHVSMPTPPNSPPPNTTFRSPPTLAAPVMPSPSPSQVNVDVSELYGSTLSSHTRPQGAQTPHYSSPPGTAISRTSIISHASPHRSQSYQPTASSHQESFPRAHRASTVSTVNSMQNGTPSLVTTARPPSPHGFQTVAAVPSSPPLQTNTFLASARSPDLSAPSFQTVGSPPPPPKQPNTVFVPTPLFASPPSLNSMPAASLRPEIYPLSPSTQAMLAPTPISAQYPQVSQRQAQVPYVPQTPKENDTNIKQLGLAFGKSVGKLALNIAGGAVKASLGLPPTRGSVGGVIGNALMNGTIDNSGIKTLGSAFTQQQHLVNTQQRPAAQALQAANQPARFGSNMQRPMQPGVQNPMSAYQNAYTTQAQPLAPSGQQYQTALQVQMQHMNIAAAQQVAPAQQHMQNITQVPYYQQQQQQQMLQQQQQMQLQQQRLRQPPNTYSQPAPQNPAYRPTGPPAHRPANQASGQNTLPFADPASGNDLSAGGGDPNAPNPPGDATYSSFTDMGQDPNANAYSSFGDMGQDPNAYNSFGDMGQDPNAYNSFGDMGQDPNAYNSFGDMGQDPNAYNSFADMGQDPNDAGY